MKDLSISCVLAIAFCYIGLLSPRGFVKVKNVSLLLLGRRRCSCDLLWSRPFVASWDLLCSLESSQSFCGLCLKIVVKAPDSALKDSDSGR